MSYISSKNKLYELQDFQLFINFQSERRVSIDIFHQFILSYANNDIKKLVYFDVYCKKTIYDFSFHNLI